MHDNYFLISTHCPVAAQSSGFFFLNAKLSNFFSFFFFVHVVWPVAYNYTWLAQAASAIDKFVDLKLTQ